MIITGNNCPNNSGLTKEKCFPEKRKKIVMLKESQLYSKLKDMNAAIAER